MNNHNRNLGNSGHYFYNDLDDLKFKATYRQVNFFKALCAKCRENGIVHNERPVGRVQFAQSIDKLLSLLREKGIDIHCKKANVDVSLEVGSSNILDKDVKVRLRKSD